jgi:Uma2 family endonuclease
MAMQLERHLFTLEEYERMIKAGVFDEDSRLELIQGEIVEMAPIGFGHGWSVAMLTRLLTGLAGGKALVWAQSAIRAGENSRPEPDIALLRWREDYSEIKPPIAQDVLLIVEVADTSLAHDRGTKGPLYARAGIPEYWIVNLRDEVIEVYTRPTKGVYKRSRKARRGATVALPAELGGAIEVNDILGKTGEGAEA